MSTLTYALPSVLAFPGKPARATLASLPGRSSERRSKSRYPLDFSVDYRSLSAGSSFSGAGLALNLGSGGVLVASKNPVVVGAMVEMSIMWPTLLDGRIPLRLTATGRVLRRGVGHFAATFERYEFRIGSAQWSVRPIR